MAHGQPLTASADAEPTQATPPRRFEISLDMPGRFRSYTVRDLIVELAGVEDAIRLHRSTTPAVGDNSLGTHLPGLAAYQRHVMHELRRRARARQATLPPGGPPPRPSPHGPQPLTHTYVPDQPAQP